MADNDKYYNNTYLPVNAIDIEHSGIGVFNIRLSVCICVSCIQVYARCDFEFLSIR